MENKNSDKIIREQMSGYHAPFDPAAWEQMEAMLDADKRKKRVVFWWLFSGAAIISLTLGTIGYYTIKNETTNQQTALRQRDIASQKTSTAITTEPENIELTTSTDRSTGGIEQIGKKKDAEQPIGKQHVSLISKSEQKDGGKFQQNKEQEKALLLSDNKPFHTQGSGKDGFTKSKKTSLGETKNEIIESPKEQSISKVQFPGILAPEAISSAPIVLKNEDPAIIARLTGVSAQLIAKQSELAAAGKTNEAKDSLQEAESRKEEEPLPPLPKKRIFGYEIGIGAAAAAFISQHQTDTTPGYSVGLVHQLNIGKWLAVSSGILMSRTAYSINKPVCTDAEAECPGFVAGKITELQIPIDLKLYPLHHKGFQLYVSAGITNHIKITETMQRSITVTQRIAAPTIDQAVVNVNFNEAIGTSNVTSVNNYVGNSPDQAFEDVLYTTTSTEKLYSKVYSINKSKKYYQSFNISMGLEYAIKNRWIVSIAPYSRYTLQAIGSTKQHRWEIGGFAGLRYRF